MVDMESINKTLNKITLVSNEKHDWFKVFKKGLNVAILGAISALTLSLKDPLNSDPMQFMGYTLILGTLIMLENHLGHRK